MGLFSKKDKDAKTAAPEAAHDHDHDHEHEHDHDHGDGEWFIPEESRAYLSQLFKGLKAPVELRLLVHGLHPAIHR